jgi:hypothetical protein
MHSKPVVVLDPDGLFEPLRQQMERFVEAGFATRFAVDEVQWAIEVETAFALLGL